MWSLGFGLERIGLLAIRWPRASLLAVALFSTFCALGIPRLKTGDTLSELFRADTTAFRNYEALSSRFPTSEFDVLVVVEGPNLLTREALEAINTLHLDLEFADAAEGVLSMFSMRDPPVGDGIPPPLIPAELPTGSAFDALAKRIQTHPLIAGKLLSDAEHGSQLALLVVSIKRDILRREGMFPLIRQIQSIAEESLQGTGLSVQLAGAPVMQMEIRDAIHRDVFIYNGFGFLVGFLVNLLFFRRLKLVLIAAICPAVAVLWGLGLLGWMGLKLNTFINVIPPLVMVIAFTDAMHMVFSIRRHLADGQDRYSAAHLAIKSVGPACVLTSLTTAIAFLSLTITDSSLIRSFGLASSLATLFAFVVVIAIVPTLVVLLFRNEAEFLRTEAKRHQAIRWLERVSETVAAWLRVQHVRVATAGVILVAICAALHLQLEPHYRLSDQVPDSRQSVAATQRLDSKLTGAYPLHVMIEWPQGLNVVSPEVVSAIRDVHRLLEESSGVGNVWSLETLAQWLEGIGKPGPESLADYLHRLPEHLVARFVNEEANAALVTGRLPDLDAHEAVKVLGALDERLAALQTRHPGFSFTVSGLSAVSAQQSSSMIRQLNWGLLGAIAVVIVLIGVAFRSTAAAFYSLLPNLFPVVAAGAVIFVSGGGLEYASVIALTVAFGIAVDDTIHFLNRLRVEEERSASLEEAVSATLSRIGPVLILTTLVLVIGLAVTIISDLPVMRLFGRLFMATLAAALIGDVLILPSVILAARKFRVIRAQL